MQLLLTTRAGKALGSGDYTKTSVYVSTVCMLLLHIVDSDSSPLCMYGDSKRKEEDSSGGSFRIQSHFS